MTPQQLSVTPLEDRLTPADVVVNYIVYFVDPGNGFGATGLTNTGTTNTGLTNTGTTNSVRTGFSGLDSGRTGFSGVDRAGLGNAIFNNGVNGVNGLGATSFGLTGLGAGSLTNAGTGGVGPSTAVTGQNGLTGTNLTGNNFGVVGGAPSFNAFAPGVTNATNSNTFGGINTIGGVNTVTGFNSINTGGFATGTNFGTTNGGVFTGNGANTVNRFNTINGQTTGVANGVTSGVTPALGGNGFAVAGANGVTITTTITPNNLTTTNGVGAAGPTVATAADVAAARGARSTLRSGDGKVGVVLNPFPGYAGELRTAVADINGDGVPDTVVAPGNGGGPRVAAFDGRTGQVLADFFAYDDALRNGVNVGAGDLDGDGRAEIVTGAGPGGGPRVRAFTIGADNQAVRTADFFAFDPNFRGGVTVAVGDATGGGVNQILTGAGVGGGPLVGAFTGAGQPVRSVFAGDPNSRGGVNVAGIANGLLAAGGPQAGLYDPATGQLVRSLGAADAANPGVVSLTTLGGQQAVRVARAGQPDTLFDLNGVAVG